MENTKICCLFNLGAHYREPIYQAISRRFTCHFFLGDKAESNIKTFDYNRLPGYRKTLRRIPLLGKFYWQKGATTLSFEPYEQYIITGEPYCVSSWLLAIICRLKGKKIITWTHGWYGREKGVKRIFKKLFFRLFTHILTYNNRSLSLMLEEGFRRERLSCIANSLDSEKQKKIRERLTATTIYSARFGDNAPVILYCGRIQKVKRPEILIDSLAEIKRRGINCHLVFVGADVENVGIATMAKKAKLEADVWEYGACYDEATLGELFYNAAVCVSPGNVGLTAIHSLTYGCPVVTHNNFTRQMPEFEAIQEGLTGSFFKEGDGKDLVDKILFWINITDEEREKTRQAAFAEIDGKWCIKYQMEILSKILDTPAPDRQKTK